MSAERLITVKITQIDMAYLRATSVDIPGLYAAARTKEKLMSEIPEAIRDLLSVGGKIYDVGVGEQIDGGSYRYRALEVSQTLRRVG